MAAKALGTATKLANLQQLKKERIAKIEEQLALQQTKLLQKRKEELFNIFKACHALTIDDKLLIGFLRFVKNVDSERSTGQAPWYLCRPKGRVQAALAPYPPAPDVLYIV